MKFAFITPTAYLPRFSSQGDIYFASAHLVDDQGKNDYASFHRREAEQGRRVVLNNGMLEGAPVEPEVLIRRAKAVRASVVCAPDVLFDSKGTIKEFKRFIRLKQEYGLVAEVMGIPQANNPADYWQCFQFMDLSPECHVVGLSLLSVSHSFNRIADNADKWPFTASRVHFVRQLRSMQSLSGHRGTPIHFLGVGENHADVIAAERHIPGRVHATCSGSAFIHGNELIRYRRGGVIPGGKISKKIDFYLNEGSLSVPQIRAIQHNIDEQRWLRRQQWRPGPPERPDQFGPLGTVGGV